MLSKKTNNGNTAKAGFKAGRWSEISIGGSGEAITVMDGLDQPSDIQIAQQILIYQQNYKFSTQKHVLM